MFFECQDKNELEAIRTEFNERARIEEVGGKEKAQLMLKHSFRSTEQEAWYVIVESYAVLEFTYPGKDRIVAISGVAKNFRDIMTRSMGMKLDMLAVEVSFWLVAI